MKNKSSASYSRSLDFKFGLIRNPSRGEIESFTVVHNAPSGFEAHTPYIVAIVKLDNGTKVTAQIADGDDVSIGSRVEPCVRQSFKDGKAGLVHHCIKFRVVK